MVSERVKRLFEDRLTIKDTRREEYWNRTIANVSVNEMGAMKRDIQLIKDEIEAAKKEGDAATESELGRILAEKEMDLKLLRAIVTEAKRLIADQKIELKLEYQAA